MRRLLKLFVVLGVGGVLVVLAGGAGMLYLMWRYAGELPDYRQLADYEPPTVTRVHAGDGRLLAEFAHEKRVFVPIEAIPRRVIQAFLAAEDKNFYSHPGIDPLSIVRAVITNVERLMDDRRPVGASTITQQVAKNFLLSNEVTLERKLKEALLAFRIEQAFTKDQILELYLNQIYLGVGSYGVAAAALNYFDKSLDELTVSEAAFLAGLPKAPSWYHPERRPDAAKARRDWVIGRMLEEGFIDRDQAEVARAEPLVMRRRAPTEVVTAEYFVEEMRRELIRRHGEDFLYQGGLSIRTTLSPELQAIAEKALRDGLIAYDRRHGWRGPMERTQLHADPGWPALLAEMDRTGGLDSWELALVLAVEPAAATIGLVDGSTAPLPLAELKWARSVDEEGNLGPPIERADQVLTAGDVVWVEKIAPSEGEQGEAHYTLRQPPEVEGALVALNPHTGRVLALQGGFSYARSEFNRATQALRQPGSALKPFVYLAALENGFTPSSILLDAPIVIDQGAGLGKWKPSNYSRRFYGPSTLRLGIEKSRNVMTVRLAQAVGMDRIREMATRFDLERGLGRNLASALGSNEVTLLQLTTAYAMLVNGGKRIEPALIERIQDRHGRTVMQRDARPCPACQNVAWEGQPAPVLPDLREEVIDPPHAYQMVNLLQGVVERGTGQRARAIGKPVAGKTGTTDDSRDAWFVGFTPDLVVGVFVGFDQPRSLGQDEQGASAALPIFVDFMTAALKDEPATPFRVPPGIRLVRVDAETGLLPGPTTDVAILEAYIPGTEPTEA
ncbi:MAG TPA: penicillin-binding protein 1A, partial [Thermomicrobiales bacterium]|nr:penicillin-binding protein 1A [Thermomicrobiales bacterium]